MIKMIKPPMDDGREWLTVDEETFEIIKLMVKEAGACDDLRKVKSVVCDLISQEGYHRSLAVKLCTLARHDLKQPLTRMPA